MSDEFSRRKDEGEFRSDGKNTGGTGIFPNVRRPDEFDNGAVFTIFRRRTPRGPIYNLCTEEESEILREYPEHEKVESERFLSVKDARSWADERIAKGFAK